TGTSGAVYFTFQVSDGYLLSSVSTAVFVVIPVATGESYTVSRNTTLNVSAPGLLANDAGSSLVAQQDANDHGPLHGSLTLNANGSFSYTPNLSFTGDDSFTYYAMDASGYHSDHATVTIHI